MLKWWKGLGALCTALPLSSHSLVAVYRTGAWLLVIHTTFLCVGRINSIYFSIGESFFFFFLMCRFSVSLDWGVLCVCCCSAVAVKIPFTACTVSATRASLCSTSLPLSAILNQRYSSHVCWKIAAYTKAGQLPLAGSCEQTEVKATSAPTYAGQASA